MLLKVNVEKKKREMPRFTIKHLIAVAIIIAAFLAEHSKTDASPQDNSQSSKGLQVAPGSRIFDYYTLGEEHPGKVLRNV